ncbi:MULTISPECIES: hypothetical protein [Rhizobium]|nr:MULTISPECIES: hypothetical protein [Rhizobium]
MMADLLQMIVKQLSRRPFGLSCFDEARMVGFGFGKYSDAGR